MLKNSNVSYGWVSIAFHWLSALLLTGLFIVGLWMADMSYYDAWYVKAPFLHKSVGVIFLMIVVLRLVWRLLNPRPEFEPGISKVETKIALGFQYLFYLLMVMTPIAGYFVATSKGHAVEVFTWFEIPAVIVFDNSKDIVSNIHAAFAWTILILALLHAAAAFKHHFINNDNTLRKMLGLKNSTTSTTKGDKK